MRWRCVLVLGFCWLACQVPALCQGTLVTPDSLGLLQSQVKRIGIHTYTGYNYLTSSHQTDSQQIALRFAHNWIYNSTATIKGFIRKDYQLQLQHSNRLGKSDFWAGQVVDFSEFQANRTSILRLLQEYAYHIKPDSNWRVSTRAFGGIRRDERFGRADFGPEAGGAAQVHLLPVPGFGTGGAGILLNRAQVGQRQFHQLKADIFYASPENLPATVQARAGYYRVNSADYLGGNVQNILTDTLFADVRLYYRLYKDISFRSVSMGALPHRRFVYRQQQGGQPEQQNFGYRQAQYETNNRLQYNKNRLNAIVEFTYRQRSRSYQLQNNRFLSGPELRNAEERERTKDISENHYIWVWEATWKLTNRHTLQGQTTAQLLRLNTPSDLNDQDRDEVYYLGKLSLESHWFAGFRTTFALAAEDKQFVYITSEQSIENYRDRILRWEPGFAWVRGRFSWNGNMQIWATYHVRDAAAEQLKNRANRTYLQTHVLALELPKRNRLQLQYTRRENRTGLLNWEDFSESPLDTVTSHDVSFSLEKKLQKAGKQTVLRAGYRLFYQGQYRIAGRQDPAGGVRTIYLHEITRQHGPEITLLQHKTGFLDVSLNLWLQIIDTYARYKTSSEPFIGMVMSEQQLEQKLHAVYPYFSCSVSWYVGGLLKGNKARTSNN